VPDIILLTGNARYTITLDPSSWLFDDRKFDLDTYFKEPHGLDNPPRKYKKRELLKEAFTFAVPLKPFLENAEPAPEAVKLVIRTKKGDEYDISLETARTAILSFTKDGKFLTENGPAHFYYGDGSNRDHPITDIAQLIIR
jgi:hypothetical protein